MPSSLAAVRARPQGVGAKALSLTAEYNGRQTKGPAGDLRSAGKTRTLFWPVIPDAINQFQLQPARANPGVPPDFQTKPRAAGSEFGILAAPVRDRVASNASAHARPSLGALPANIADKGTLLPRLLRRL